MDYLTSTLVGLCIGAVVVYGFLRLTTLTSDKFDALRAARSHGFWTALIAFFASSASFSNTPANMSFAAESITEDRLLVFAVRSAIPMLCLGGIYVLAQFTWPRPRGALRQAEVSARRVSDFVPRALTVVTGTFALIASVTVLAVAGLPAVQQGFEVDGNVLFARRSDGSLFATASGVALAVLLIGVTAAVLVITRRRRIASLTPDDDAVVRQIGINRLLRTTVLALTGIISNAIKFATSGIPNELLVKTGTSVVWEVAGQASPWVSLVVLIGVVAWAPPKLRESSEDAVTAPLAPAGSYARVLRLSNAAGRVGYGLLILPGVPLVLSLWAPEAVAIPLALLSLGFGAYLLLQVVVEHIVARNHSVGPHQRTPIRGLVPLWLQIALVVSVVTSLSCVLVLNLATTRGLPGVAWILGSVILLCGLAAWAVNGTLSRPRLAGVDTVHDRLLRAVTLHRTFRGCTSAMLFITAYLLVSESASWPLIFGDYRPPSLGIHPMIAVAQAAVMAVAIVIVLIPGPTRPPADTDIDTAGSPAEGSRKVNSLYP